VHLTTEEFQIQRDSEFVSEQAGQLLSEQDKFIDYVVHSDSLIAINSNHHSIANNKPEKFTYEEIL
jgi:hypothetical protein